MVTIVFVSFSVYLGELSAPLLGGTDESTNVIHGTPNRHYTVPNDAPAGGTLVRDRGGELGPSLPLISEGGEWGTGLEGMLSSTLHQMEPL